MRAPRYIYISDQGRVFSSADDPTPEDFAYANVGMITILRLEDHHCYRSDGKWRPIADGKLASANVDGMQTGEFHADPSDMEFSSEPEISFPDSDAEKLSGRCWTRSKPADARRRRFTSS